MDTTINVAFATDDKYVFAVAVAMWSILEKTPNDVDFHIIENNLSDHSKSLLAQIPTHFPRAKVKLYPLPASLRALTPSPALQGTLARLLIPQIMPEISPIIYMDADVLAMKNVSPLYNADLGGAPIGVIKNFRTIEKQCVANSSLAFLYPKTVAAARSERARLSNDLGVDSPEQYINAGVFLLDTAAILREPDLLARLCDVEYALKKRKKDQDWIFHVFAGRMQFLAPQWNCYSTIGRANMWALAGAEKKAFVDAKADPGIVHFVGKKPWDSGGFSGLTTGLAWRNAWRGAAQRMNSVISVH